MSHRSSRLAFLFAFTFMLSAGAAHAQSPAPQPSAVAPAPRPADVASAEAIVAALYDVISGPKGQARDWQRFRSLFAPGAHMVPSGRRPDGGLSFRVQTPEDYIERSGKVLLDLGFVEKEIFRKTEQFGPLAHVFSTYEARREGDVQPFVRGINSIQLMNDGARWWILTVAWSPESPAQPLPAAYLPH
jgi:hypothetical protein